MNKKVVYETKWIAKDTTKEYPHGWGFDAPIVEAPQDMDPADIAKWCRENLSNEEFECIYVIPKEGIAIGTDTAESRTEAISGLIRYGYQHAVTEMEEWVKLAEDKLDKEYNLLSQKYIGENEIMSKLAEMSNPENKKTINIELLKKEMKNGQ